MVSRIFRKLHVKLDGLVAQKLTKPNLSKKFSFWGKAQTSSEIKGFFGFRWKNNYVFFTLKMLHNSLLDESAKAVCLGKIWFFIYILKRSQHIRLRYSFILISLEEINQYLRYFTCQDLRLLLLVGWGTLRL